MKLNVKAFAITTGLLWGLAVLCITWWIIMFDGATGEKIILGKIYRGYNVSAMGSLIGLIWALPDGFIGGAIFAWVYNKIVACTAKE